MGKKVLAMYQLPPLIKPRPHKTLFFGF